MVPKFWQIESYSVSEKQNPDILPQMEQRALDILKKTKHTTSCYIVVLSYNKNYRTIKLRSVTFVFIGKEV